MILLIAVGRPFSVYTQNKKTVVINTSTYENGKIRKKLKLTTIRSKKPSVYDFYWKKKLEVNTFDSLGFKDYEHIRITRYGTYGRNCYEILYEFKQYNKDTLVWTYKSTCDCQKEKYKTYYKGKLETETTKKRHFYPGPPPDVERKKKQNGSDK